MEVTMVTWLALVVVVVCTGTVECNRNVTSASNKVYATASGEDVCVCGKTLRDVRSSAKTLSEQALQPPASCTDGKPKDCGNLPRSCPSGVYIIYPKFSKGFKVFCEMEKYGGGWTVIQRRGNGAVNFLRNWNDYKKGFGDLMNEFWLGNDYIHSVTYQDSYQLMVELTDYDDNKAIARYRNFMVGSESIKYKLSVSMYSGDAGDSLTISNGMKFTTTDNDNDTYSNNCAKLYSGAWWFQACFYAHLNGEYFYTKNPRSKSNGVIWYHWKGSLYSLKATEMMVRAL